MRKLPGKTSYTDITLKWGLTDSTGAVGLAPAGRRRRPSSRKNGSIVVSTTSPTSTEVARWNFVSAWPTKWEGPAFNAKGNEIAVDTLVLAHEGLARA